MQENNETMDRTEESFESSKHTSEDAVFSKKDVFEWLEVITAAFVVVLLLFSLVFKVATIDGKSMENTLHDRERVVISDMGYTPKQGDIVVISRNYDSVLGVEDRNSLPLIKRVIAVAGQTVSIDFDEGIVYVEGKALKEPYIKEPTFNKFDIDFPFEGDVVTVPENCIFVLGDNRNNSLDSRAKAIGNFGNGMIDKRYVLGRVLTRIFPFDKFGKVN